MKDKSALYLCLCIRNFYAQTYLRFHPQTRNSAVAIIDDTSPVKTVIDMTHVAAARGLTIGMTSVHASLDPETVLVPRTLVDDTMNRLDIVHACHQISPLIEDCSTGEKCILILDITASFALFADVDQLVHGLLTLLRPMSVHASVAVSSHFHTCRLLAQATQGNTICCLIPKGQERTYLSKLPVTSLDLDLYQAETFANWGMDTLGDLASLPLDELVSRMGDSATRLYGLAHGTFPHVFQPLQFAELFKEHICFDSPIDLFESLLFSLAPMLDRLALRAQEEMKWIASVNISMGLEDRSTHSRNIQPAVPSTSTQLFIKLIHLDLESHPPKAAVNELTLIAILGVARKVQLGMFSPQHPDTSQLDVTLARIRKLVGAGHVGSPLLDNSHHPCSSTMNAFEASDTSGHDVPRRNPLSVIRRARANNHILVQVRDNAPASFTLGSSQYKVVRAYGPWRSTGKWWSSNAWNLEHWDTVANQLGTEGRLQCCLSLNLVNHRWTLEGLYD